ncbi:MAG: fused MFS/spermidine synthase [Deltaproteobacteria bacterium]|nr:fused MFS/spermidine synthase [Deltaproteobacteria bacterium]
MAVRKQSRRQQSRKFPPANSPKAPAAPAPFARRLRCLVFLSGAAALVYQSLWVRQLSLILGSTTYAVGTVLAAFMAGLGVGAWVLGRRADDSPAPLRLYAALELAIGAVGLLSPLLLAQGNAIYVHVYARLHATPGLLTFARFLIGFGFVAIPALLMGGTLPVATRYVVRHSEQVGREVGLLYALNTAGAAVGALVLPFGLLPWLGMRRTLIATAATNVAIALAAMSAVGREPAAAAPAPSSDRTRAAVPAVGRGVLPAFFLSGFVALALEVVWNRFFAMYVGSSIYSYAIILFLYLVGIAVGGVLFTVLDRRGADPIRVLVATLILLVLDLALSVPLMDGVLYLQLTTLDAIGIGFWPFQIASAAAAGVIVLPPTMLFGVAFPAVVRAVSPTAERVGSRVGLAYLVNTGGTTAGALAASFVLVPRLGLRPSLDVLVVLAALAAALAARRTLWASAARLAMVGSVAVVALLPTIAPGWDARLMHTAISKQPSSILHVWRERRLTRELDTVTVRELRDGVDASVSVVDYDVGMRVLFVNGKPDAGNGPDMLTQALLGHLPLLAHPAPKAVLVIGMGSGVTLGAVVHYPVASIDLVEISPEVVDLAARWFATENHGAIDDPRLSVHLEDGRNFVAFREDRAWDVIINEPSNPWMTGVANLFTDEFFAQVRGRLRPDGILAQWFHYYNMPIDDVRGLLATLRRHFERVYVFALRERAVSGDMVVLAANHPIDFTAALTALLGGGPTSDDLRHAHLDAAELLEGFVLGPENIDAFVGGAPLNSDDHPVIELDAPRALFDETVLANFETLQRASEGARLPLAGAGDLAADFRLTPPAGFRRTFSGLRNTLAPAPLPGAIPVRSALMNLEFEDDSGRRIAVLSERGARDRAGLERLTRLVAGGPVAVAGDATVDGHVASAYALAGGETALAWTCPDSNSSYAAVFRGGPNHEGDVAVLGGLRCHVPR